MAERKAEAWSSRRHVPFVKALGFELLSVGDGEAEIRLPLREEHLNGFMVAHGGVCMTLLDVAMAQAARSVNRDQPGWGPGVVTIEMKTSFMRAGEGDLRAEGRLRPSHRHAGLLRSAHLQRERRDDRAGDRHLQVPPQAARAGAADAARVRIRLKA